jgi:hypothetical protein
MKDGNVFLLGVGEKGKRGKGVGENEIGGGRELQIGIHYFQMVSIDSAGGAVKISGPRSDD